MIILTPNKATYNEHDMVSLSIFPPESIELTIKITNDRMDTSEFKAHFIDGISELSAWKLENGSYLLSAFNKNELVAQTALDVSPNCFRYGFLSDFSSAAKNDEKPIKWLNRLHIDHVQYYDWMYRHDDLIPKSESFTDLLGRHHDLGTITKRIRETHQHGMKSLAYGAIYGATNDFAKAHPDWQLYTINGKPITFFDFLSIMNVDASCPWHDHIIAEYQKAIKLGFDGIHMDTYGFPKHARDATGASVNLPTTFAQLIDDTKRALLPLNENTCLVFNNVGNWPVAQTAPCHQDAVYVEVWDPDSDYAALQNIIVNARHFSSDKPVILAAYLKPYAQGDSEDALASWQLLTAIITTLGATHLINGDDRGIITQGYYTDHHQVSDSDAITKIVEYYDYLTALSVHFFDPTLKDVSRTHFRGDNREFTSEYSLLSPNLDAGHIWTNIRENTKKTLLNFINLTSLTNTKWNEQHQLKSTEPFTINVLLSHHVRKIVYSSPDADSIQFTELNYDLTENEFGQYATIQVPSFICWSTVQIYWEAD